MMENFQRYLKEKLKAERSSNDTDPTVPDFYQRLMSLPVELQLLVFENLDASDFITLKQCSKTIHTQIDLLARSIAATKPQIQTFKEYLAGFEYKNVPLVEALQHWNLNKGIALRDLDFNGTVFARFYIWKNKDVDTETVWRKPPELDLGYATEMATLLTGLHMSTHMPQAETIGSDLYDLLSDPEFYEKEIRRLTQQNFTAEIELNNETAINKIKKHPEYFGSKIWIKNLSGKYKENDSIAAFVTQAGARLGQLMPVTPVHTGLEKCPHLDDDLNSLPRGLGIPLLPFPWHGEQTFAYCWKSSLDKNGLEVPIHNVKMLHRKDGALKGLFQDPGPLLKAHIIERLTIY